MLERGSSEPELEFKNLTLPEAADALGVSLATARRLVRSGKLKALKVQHEDRSRWEVSPEWLEEFKLNSELAFQERASKVQNERKSKEPKFSSDPEVEASGGLLQAHLAALALVERLQQKVEDDQRRFELLARSQGAMQQELAQYQRALTEAAESLAEERAHRLTLEAQQQAPAPSLPQELPLKLSVPAPCERKGWRHRLRSWLLGA